MKPDIFKKQESTGYCVTKLPAKLTEYLCAPRERFQRHPLVEKVPILPAESEAYRGMQFSITSEGIREPLKCVPKGEKLLVLDGIHRLAIAEELKIPELPFVQVAGEDAISVVCSALVRAEWTKSALAYRMWPLFAVCACKRGGDRKSKGNDFPLISAAEIAQKLGVSEKLVDQAKRLHSFFAKNSTAREQQEYDILTGKLPLHKAGPNAEHKNGKETSPIRTIETSLARLPKSFGQWDQISECDKERAKNKLATALHQLPRDVQVTAIDVLELAIGR